jgi:hypothetical protein
VSEQAFCLFASRARTRVLAGRVRHDPAQALRVAAELPDGPWRRSGATTFDEALGSRTGDAYVGAFGDTVVVAKEDLWDGLDDGPVGPTPWVDAVLRALPGSRVLVAVVAHGSWGYAWFEAGRRVRARSGILGERLLLDVGEPVPEDAVWVQRRRVVDGERSCVWEDAEGRLQVEHENDAGYEAAVEQSREFLGCGLLYDELAERIPVEVFQAVRASGPRKGGAS